MLMRKDYSLYFARCLSVSFLFLVLFMDLARSFRLAPQAEQWILTTVGGDKALHFLIAALLQLALPIVLTLKYAPKKSVHIAFIALVFLLSLAESTQLWVATRTFQPEDLLAGLLGAGSVWVVSALLMKADKHSS